MTLAKSPVLDTTVLTPFDRITAEVEIAESKAVPTFGDYRNPAINKAARSYIYGLRQVRTSIDRTRKAQNDEAQSYIRNVNGFAKELTERVTALIEPHERIIKGIEEAEKERIAAHEADLDTIIEMRRGPHGDSARIMKLLDDLTGIDPTTFEEFTPKADAEIQITRAALETALQAAIDHEEAEAARQKKREEEAEAARLKREAEIAEAAAAKATADAEAKAERLRAKAAREAEAAIEAERKAAQERGQQIHAEMERALAAERQKTREAAAAAKPPEPVFDAEQLPGNRAKRNAMVDIIKEAVLDSTPKGFALAVVLGEVHPAIVIDWSKVEA
jgi:F0F1-type ATP synthase membrane subunit b/b'